MDLNNWTARPVIDNRSEKGVRISLVPFDATHHAQPLWDAFGGDQTNNHLKYFGWAPLKNAEALGNQIAHLNQIGGFSTCVFQDNRHGQYVGMASYMRTDAQNGVTEVGAVGHGLSMARTPLATEAHYMMMRRAFDTLGYRRYEWKLNNLNRPSHEAALRLGFQFEGVFRNLLVVHGNKNRDTAWYSIIAEDWPLVKAAFEAWLAPNNFDAKGQQKQKLQEIRAALSA